MAQRTITHFRVRAQLFNDITAILFELPAKASRTILNRIEGTEGECEPIFAIELAASRKGNPAGNGKKPPTRKRRARKPPKPRKKLARKKRGA